MSDPGDSSDPNAECVELGIGELDFDEVNTHTHTHTDTRTHACICTHAHTQTMLSTNHKFTVLIMVTRRTH